MKKILRSTGLVIAVAAIGYLTSCDNKEKEKTDSYASSTPSTACLCDSSWFPHSQTPAPAEGIGSPFDTSSTTNCMFHQWSWQKFLWLTKPMADNNPLFMDSMILVTNEMTPVAPVNGVKLVLTDTGQAGTNGVLTSNPAFNSNNNAYTVYYGIFVNHLMQDAAFAFKELMIHDTALLSNKFVFPIGSLELKTSWVDSAALAPGQAANYYITDAVVSGKKIRAALLGMHVVGVVINHPEFIWATFEHKDMAPAYNWAATTTQDVPVTSNNQQLFFRQGDTATWQNLQWNSTNPRFRSVFTAYPFGVPRIANDSFMTVAQSEPLNYDNIQTINACVAGQLNDVWNNYFYNGSIWMNMDGLNHQQQADSIVTLLANGQDVTDSGTVFRGCIAAFNLTMETFVQVDQPMSSMNAANLTNCFSCHGSQSKVQLGSVVHNTEHSPLYLSHIFRSYLSKSTGVPVPAIERLRIRDFLDVDAVKKRTLLMQKKK